MKIDKTTYKDKEENQIGMTADHTSRPDRVLFFADPHFLFLRPCTQMAHCLLPCAQIIASQKSKSHFFLRMKRVNLQKRAIMAQLPGCAMAFSSCYATWLDLAFFNRNGWPSSLMPLTQTTVAPLSSKQNGKSIPDCI